jgi:hypothetical protein
MSTRTTPASLSNQTRSRFEERPVPKDVKNADRSEEVYENKGHHDKLPEKKIDFVSEITKLARNFGAFARNFAGFAHENRSWADACRYLARQTRRYTRCETRRTRAGTLCFVPGVKNEGASGDVYENKGAHKPAPSVSTLCRQPCCSGGRSLP